MTDNRKRTLHGAFAVLAMTMLELLPGRSVGAQEMSLELNKLAQRGEACRLTFFIQNSGADRFETFKIELVLFGDDGIIDRRFTGDLATLRPAKATVVSFDLDALKCQGVSQVLLNDVVDCADPAGVRTDCVEKLDVRSRAGVPLIK